jgi:hypothetical protein
MTPLIARLVSPAREPLGVAALFDEGDHFGGTIDLARTPGHVLALFEEFEEVVNGQVFSVLDEIQQRIEALNARVVFEDGTESRVTDLQVYPKTGAVSLKLAAAPREDHARSAS